MHTLPYHRAAPLRARHPLGVAALLPVDARDYLVAAAATGSMRMVNAAVAYARTKYPRFFNC